MKIERTGERAFLLHASEPEMVLLNNAINEICHGLGVPEFETRIGVPLSEAQSVLKAIRDALAGDIER